MVAKTSRDVVARTRSRHSSRVERVCITFTAPVAVRRRCEAVARTVPAGVDAKRFNRVGGSFFFRDCRELGAVALGLLVSVGC